jgi:hypothetical protein
VKKQLAAVVMIGMNTSIAQVSALPILGYERDEGGLEVRVPTGGCTSKGDFGIEKNTVGTNHNFITIIRNREDFCKGYFPEGTLLHFSWAELGLNLHEGFSVTNTVDPRATPF